MTAVPLISGAFGTLSFALEPSDARTIERVGLRGVDGTELRQPAKSFRGVDNLQVEETYFTYLDRQNRKRELSLTFFPSK